MPVFFDISKYLEEKYFVVVWGYHLPRRPPQNGPSKNQFFEGLNLRCLCFFYISRYLRDKYLDVAWGTNPPPNGPPHN